MFGLQSRLVQAQQASSPTRYLEEEHVKAGREAEQIVFELLKTEGGIHPDDMFCRIRIPSEFHTRRYEIDIVILTAYGLFAVEIKNWSGEVNTTKDKESWVQRKRKHGDNGASVEYELQHNNAAASIQSKTQLLRNHLIRNGCCLKEKFFHHRVLFVNKNVKLHEDIASIPEVILPETMSYFVKSFQWSLLGKITSALTPSLLSGQLSYSVMDSARSILSKTGTWDVIELHGGKQLQGDFRGCEHFTPNRAETEILQFSHQRSPKLSSTWAVLGYTPQVEVTMFTRDGLGWFWNSTVGSVNIPYNSDVVFRVADENTDSKIPAHKIDKIILSV
ncbi:uncharacterized protein LOC100374335 [Saccoglossus kowalevskii]|uniref:Uncharacterized protein LOC100374335 n=1 Tax=Saccoglossus kowalevskii TaxID=10224 RepID=A0ABM0GWP2_SACKO|nr:PREDICTED: uncharacterized protein LOC100374335 [Saccoglossus kowalevskii]